ncbi:hypothetical protein AURDEDRAFT_178603 [Auricularia subglabra TFB-10046 SS5]|uniref:Uncharacterized protein n=1 Tax=Auricularia subglabra (strain TFB-10046 / SS5) TaxID=717982 RepID=J0L7M9_AURST|nr:hypothetical protein AURDEDRAFT_178603 [Auricularia subglabra TFB-10046 SS5]
MVNAQSLPTSASGLPIKSLENLSTPCWTPTSIDTAAHAAVVGPYELRAVKIGSRCVVPLKWTPLPAAGHMTSAEIVDFLAMVAKTYRYENDPRFTHLFGEPLPEEEQDPTSWDYRLEALDMYSVHHP